MSDRKKGKFRQQFVKMAQERAKQESTVEKKSLSAAQKANIKQKVDKLGQVDKDGNNLREKRYW